MTDSIHLSLYFLLSIGLLAEFVYITRNFRTFPRSKAMLQEPRELKISDITDFIILTSNIRYEKSKEKKEAVETITGKALKEISKSTKKKIRVYLLCDSGNVDPKEVESSGSQWISISSYGVAARLKSHFQEEDKNLELSTVHVQSSESISQSFNTVSSLISEIVQKGMLPNQIACEVKGGTKQMAVGAVLASLGQCRITSFSQDENGQESGNFLEYKLEYLVDSV